jgi:hypothetical protein
MDACQPITFVTESKGKVFILLVEDADILNNGDSECCCYASSHFVIDGGAYFKSPKDALDDAVKRIKAISPIKSVLPTRGFDEFFDDQTLQQYVS